MNTTIDTAITNTTTRAEASAKAAIKTAYQMIEEGDKIAAFAIIELLLTSEGMPAELR